MDKPHRLRLVAAAAALLLATGLGACGDDSNDQSPIQTFEPNQEPEPPTVEPSDQ